MKCGTGAPWEVVGVYEDIVWLLKDEDFFTAHIEDVRPIVEPKKPSERIKELFDAQDRSVEINEHTLGWCSSIIRYLDEQAEEKKL